ncbi:YcjF family protein [Rhodocyclaceae bacterium SMB388]
MNNRQARSVVAVSLMAAFADGRQDPGEREHVRKVAESLSGETDIDFIALYQDVLLGRLDLQGAVDGLDTPELRDLAFEMAVGVCEADGSHNTQETAFLDRLTGLLGLDRAEAENFVLNAEAVAESPVNGALAEIPSAVRPNPAELDRIILHAAILNGALELLPQSMASMAIIPLQVRLVYRIGQAHGFELDRGHIKDFLATTGVGMTGQYVEQLGRKLVGGVLGKVFGGVGRAIGSQATGSAFSFATTYAIGQVANRYYGDGRKLDTAALKATFAQMFEQAKTLQSRHTQDIQERARTLDLKKLTAELRA